MTDIIDSGDVAESNGEDERTSDLLASTDEKPDGISFHVQMRAWTARDMEELIVEAAARMIVGRSGESRLTKLIEERAIAILTEKANAILSRVADDVLNHTVTKEPFAKGQPVTIGEMLGMLGREYLQQIVDSTGKVSTSSYDYCRDSRIAKIVSKAMEGRFAKEIEAETNKTLSEVRGAIKASHVALVEKEKARFLAALAAANI